MPRLPHQNPAPLTVAERAAFDALHRTSDPDESLADDVFAIAARDLDEWPEGRRRLRRARRHLLHGRATYDLWFAADLIARALEADAGLVELEIVAVFDRIGLPIDAVPHFAALSEHRTSAGAYVATEASVCDDLWPDDEAAEF